MRKWGRVAWDGLVMCKEERLIYQWGRVSWFKGMENGRGRSRITLEVVKNNMSSKEVTMSMTFDRIGCRKRIHVADLD